MAWTLARVSQWVGMLGFACMIAACSNPNSPSCQNDRQCQRADRQGFCIAGHCQQCRHDTDCPAGQSCMGNRCSSAIAGMECGGEQACPTGYVCQDGRCAPDTFRNNVAAISSDGGRCSFAAVRFSFDDADLSRDVRNALHRTAECMQREGSTHYVLIGRTDPRGTTEYNLALGERRARSVQRFLISLGVGETRLGVSSVGSEGATGSDENGWAQDRRVDQSSLSH